MTDQSNDNLEKLKQDIISDMRAFHQAFFERLRKEAALWIAPLERGADATPIPEVCVCIENHSVLRIGDQKLDLRRKPVTLQLIKAFVEAPQMRLTKDQLMQKLYGSDLMSSFSQRYVLGRMQNLVKLISRARKHLQGHFAFSNEFQAIWFVHDQLRDEWTFVKFSI